MAWVAVDKDGIELVCESNLFHIEKVSDLIVKLPKGSIEKLIGRKLTWEDEPIELKEIK